LDEKKILEKLLAWYRTIPGLLETPSDDHLLSMGYVWGLIDYQTWKKLRGW
jgi:hypothetical protein